ELPDHVALRVVGGGPRRRRLVAVVGIGGEARPALGRIGQIENMRIAGHARLLAAGLTDGPQQAPLVAAALSRRNDGEIVEAVRTGRLPVDVLAIGEVP